MGKKRTLVNKYAKKKIDGKCYFCGCDDYNLLDVHRIDFDKEINQYTEHNTIVVCALCHRKIHSGTIKIYRKYLSTKGTVLHYLDEKGIEHYD